MEVGQSDEVKLAIDAEKATELESEAVEEVSPLYKDEANISQKRPLRYNTPRKATRKATPKATHKATPKATHKNQRTWKQV